MTQPFYPVVAAATPSHKSGPLCDLNDNLGITLILKYHRPRVGDNQRDTRFFLELFNLNDADGISGRRLETNSSAEQVKVSVFFFLGHIMFIITRVVSVICFQNARKLDPNMIR